MRHLRRSLNACKNALASRQGLPAGFHTAPDRVHPAAAAVCLLRHAGTPDASTFWPVVATVRKGRRATPHTMRALACLLAGLVLAFAAPAPAPAPAPSGDTLCGAPRLQARAAGLQGSQRAPAGCAGSQSQAEPPAGGVHWQWKELLCRAVLWKPRQARQGVCQAPANPVLYRCHDFSRLLLGTACRPQQSSVCACHQAMSLLGVQACPWRCPTPLMRLR